MGDIVEVDDLALALADSEWIEEARALILDGNVIVARSVFEPAWVDSVRAYLCDVGRSSLPNHAEIARGAPNFHRINRWDPRAQVIGCFHQFSFFPWNNDPLDLFAKCKLVFEAKNLISGNQADRYWGAPDDEDYAPRLSFQFYPRGAGGLNRHADPVGDYQLTVPIMTMSTKGVDFKEGGAFVDVDGSRVCADDFTSPGDVIFFNAQLPHGVERVDPEADEAWTQFEGRWMLLFALNHVGPLSERVSAEDLDR